MEWLTDKFLAYGAIFFKVAWASLIMMIICLVIVFIIFFKEQKEKNKLIAKIMKRKPVKLRE